MLAFFEPSIFPARPPSPPPPCRAGMRLSARSPILCLKSHLRLCTSDTVLPFLDLFSPPDCPICQPRSSPSAAAATRATDAFIVLLFLAPALLHTARSHLPPARDGRAPGPRAAWAFIHPSPRPPREPLIPSSRHPVTEEWPVRRAGPEWDTRAAVVRTCVLSRARGNQRR